MEKVGEKLTEGEEEVSKVIGKVLITVYNDCFSVEHSAALSTEDVVGLFVATLDKLTGSEQDEQKRVTH